MFKKILSLSLILWFITSPVYATNSLAEQEAIAKAEQVAKAKAEQEAIAKIEEIKEKNDFLENISISESILMSESSSFLEDDISMLLSYYEKNEANIISLDQDFKATMKIKILDDNTVDTLPALNMYFFDKNIETDLLVLKLCESNAKCHKKMIISPYNDESDLSVQGVQYGNIVNTQNTKTEIIYLENENIMHVILKADEFKHLRDILTLYNHLLFCDISIKSSHDISSFLKNSKVIYKSTISLEYIKTLDTLDIKDLTPMYHDFVLL
jgi:hypothetical protein